VRICKLAWTLLRSDSSRTQACLQELATRQLTDAEATSSELNALTGFHLTDGRVRVIAVEGPSGGAMASLVAQVPTAAFDCNIAKNLSPTLDCFSHRTSREGSHIWRDLV
jgi:hypothetical protein